MRTDEGLVVTGASVGLSSRLAVVLDDGSEWCLRQSDGRSVAVGQRVLVSYYPDDQWCRIAGGRP